MITVGMNYEVREGKTQAFERKFALVVEAMQGMAGHSHTQLYRCVGQERSYLVVSEWEQREAYESFVASDTFRKVTSWGKAAILSERPRHEVYEHSRAVPLTGECPAEHA